METHWPSGIVLFFASTDQVRADFDVLNLLTWLELQGNPFSSLLNDSRVSMTRRVNQGSTFENFTSAFGESMDHFDIKTDQAKELEKRVFAMLAYLRSMQSRIRELKFPEDDDLKKRVDQAESAVSNLQSLLTCMACGSGMGRPPQRK